MAATKMNSPVLPQNQRTDVHPGAFRVFAGIFAEIPGALASTFELGRTGAISSGIIIMILLMHLRFIKKMS